MSGLVEIDSPGTPSGWPYPAVSDDYKAGAERWRQITEETADQFLNVLPPIYYRGGFMVSEASTHDERGVPVYLAVVAVGPRRFCRECPKDKAAEWTERLLRTLCR